MKTSVVGVIGLKNYTLQYFRTLKHTMQTASAFNIYYTLSFTLT